MVSLISSHLWGARVSSRRRATIRSRASSIWLRGPSRSWNFHPPAIEAACYVTRPGGRHRRDGEWWQRAELIVHGTKLEFASDRAGSCHALTCKRQLAKWVTINRHTDSGVTDVGFPIPDIWRDRGVDRDGSLAWTREHIAAAWVARTQPSSRAAGLVGGSAGLAAGSSGAGGKLGAAWLDTACHSSAARCAAGHNLPCRFRRLGISGVVPWFVARRGAGRY